ncbi:hypothetical protein DBR32_08715 [Taibaiella sp. KBW10]|uniref:hypothetical protein n=1 Tax=Taibaiella sp. KBW10 TaxID=2153357 RepID=UPI000F59458E|nr:hypothetical protein [Taibaiella sp. KBW10]RQO30795.1 hypothetical protein DBR32_08715 [Taibaiella sp. KBW10]
MSSPYRKIAAALVFISLGFASCDKSKDPTYSVIPELTYKSVNTTSVSYKDTGRWEMYYDFVDGDGNIGTDYTDSALVVNIKNVTTGVSYKYPFPYVPPASRYGKKYLKGAGSISLAKNVFFLPRIDTIHVERDTFKFEVFVTDNAGNQSNTISSPDIFVHP